MQIRTLDGSPAIETLGIDAEIVSPRLAGRRVLIRERLGYLVIELYSESSMLAETSDGTREPVPEARMQVNTSGFLPLK